MSVIVILTAVLILAAGGPVGAQERGGGLGGVLDTLGGLLGRDVKAAGTVVLSRDTSLVFRTDDGRTLRLDTASLDADTRRQLTAGQAATITARGAGDIMTATDVQIEQGRSPRTFSMVGGTVQEPGQDRLVFRTREGLTLPVETSGIRGLPSFQPDVPATLIYERGPRQEIVAVWLEPGDVTGAATWPSGPPTPSASPRGTATTGSRTVEGTVESMAMAELTLQMPDGRRVDVDTSRLPRGALDTVRPGDRVTVTGTPDADRGRIVAGSLDRASP